MSLNIYYFNQYIAQKSASFLADMGVHNWGKRSFNKGDCISTDIFM